MEFDRAKAIIELEDFKEVISEDIDNSLSCLTELFKAVDGGEVEIKIKVNQLGTYIDEKWAKRKKVGGDQDES